MFAGSKFNASTKNDFHLLLEEQTTPLTTLPTIETTISTTITTALPFEKTTPNPTTETIDQILLISLLVAVMALSLIVICAIYMCIRRCSHTPDQDKMSQSNTQIHEIASVFLVPTNYIPPPTVDKDTHPYEQPQPQQQKREYSSNGRPIRNGRSKTASRQIKLHQNSYTSTAMMRPPNSRRSYSQRSTASKSPSSVLLAQSSNYTTPITAELIKDIARDPTQKELILFKAMSFTDG